MDVSSTQIPVIGSVNLIVMLKKQLTVSLHPKHQSNKKKFHIARIYRSVVCPHIHVVNCTPGILHFILLFNFIWLILFCMLNISSGFWLPATSPIINDEVQVNATKPLQIAKNRWQLRLTMNGNI